MGLQPLHIFNSLSVEAVFRRHNLTSKDARLWRLKMSLALKEFITYNDIAEIKVYIIILRKLYEIIFIQF